MSIKISKMSKKLIQKKDGLFYHPYFIKKNEKDDIVSWLKTLHPIWEMRFSKHNPPPEGDEQRPLLRPVYWLGNWQFACLNYYHPPKGILHRCMKAEEYPKELKHIVQTIEGITKITFKKNDLPKGWKLNTCLINFYGTHLLSDGKKLDTARVGDHKDFEPGPVASLSFGERAFFQFVLGKKELKNNVVFEQWLEDSSLLIFGGNLYKEKTFHRVQRVENKLKKCFSLNVENFETRRINFTFRYVPPEHIVPFQNLPNEQKEDILPYVEKLAEHTTFFKNIIKPS